MCKVLVIDDDKDLMEITRLLLEANGFEVQTDRNWEGGFDQIRNFNPQVILLDVFLSGVDGLDICRQLKASSDTSHIPILVCSGYPRIADSALFEYGADDFLAKPFEINDLISRLHDVISEPAGLA